MTPGAHHGGESFTAIGTSFQHLDRATRVIRADVLDAWFPPAPRVLRAISEHLPFLLSASPPIYAEGLRDAIAQHRRLPFNSIITGAGSSDLIFRYLPQCIAPGSTVLILDPMYSEYEHVCRKLAGVRIEKHPLHVEDQFSLDPDAFIRTVDRLRPDCIMVVNPNSPTGRHLPKRDLLRILDATSALVIVDEAYIDYVDPAESVEHEAAERTNLIVIKSMSKVYALSGARVAYLIAGANRVASLAQGTPPWAVSLPAQVAAVEALQSTPYYTDRYAQTHRLRQQCVADSVGLRVYDTDLNFYLLEVDDAAQFASRLKPRGIFLRNCDSFSPCFANRFLRVTITTASTGAPLTPSHLVA